MSSAKPLHLTKIISGGQTGVDRAALDFARARGLAHGGWCPLGRWAEDGPIPERYSLQETPSADPGQRTEWNIRDADGTVIFSLGEKISGGTLRTWEVVEQYRKPGLRLFGGVSEENAARLRGFLERHRIGILNIAGPRHSEEPHAGEHLLALLEKVLGPKVPSKA